MSSNVRIRCPKCAEEGADTSQDNFIVNATTTPPHAHCHSCGYHDNNFDISTLSKQQLDLASKKSKQLPLIPKGDFMELKSRGISKKTCEMYNYSVSKNSFGEWVQVVNWKNPKTGKIDAQKTRNNNKKFLWHGNKDKVDYLFGQWIFNPNPKLTLVVTEGELDCLAYSQGVDNKWPCVSIRNGANSALKEMEQAAEWLNGWKKVVLLFDSDEAGEKAAAEVAASPKFKHGKIHIARLPEGEDPNSLLLKNKFNEVNTAVLRSSEQRLEDIVRLYDYSYDELFAADPFGSPITYPLLNDMIRGIKSKRLYLVTAGSGLGKTTFVKEVAYDLAVNQNVKIGNMFLEQDDRECMRDYIAIDNNIESNTFSENPELVSKERIAESMARLNENMVFYKHFGSLNSEVLLNKIEYMMNAIDCDVVILDHISIVISGDIGTGNERKDIDMLMTNLRSLIERTGKSVIAIVHLTRRDGKCYNEGGSVSLSDLRGSGALEQLSDFVIALERDQFSSHPDMCKLKVLKCRRGGNIGYADTCMYNKKTGRLLPINSEKEQEFINQSEDDNIDWDCF